MKKEEEEDIIRALMGIKKLFLKTYETTLAMHFVQKRKPEKPKSNQQVWRHFVLTQLFKAEKWSLG